MNNTLHKRIQALEAKLRTDPVSATLGDGRIVTLGGKDPAMRLLRAAIGCNGSAEDMAVLRDAMSFEDCGDHLAELALAIYQSPVEEHTNA